MTLSRHHARMMFVLAFTAIVTGGCAGGSNMTRYKRDGWLATVRNDPFTGERHCMLQSSGGRLVYQPGALGIRTSLRDTPDAVYRIDDGRPVRWTDRYPALVAAGVEVDGGGLSDPTGGIVWIPEADIAGARHVHLRVGERGTVRAYRLGGVAAMLTMYRQLGCVAGSDRAR